MNQSTSTPASALFHRPWWQPVGFDYSSVEVLCMRIAFAVLLFVSIKWETAPYVEQRNPTGLAHFFDLTWLSAHPPGLMVQVIVALLLLFYAVGYFPALGLAPATLVAVLIGTLVTSTAMHHSWQLVTMIALAQLIVYAWPQNESWHRRLVGLGLAVIVLLAVLESKGIVVTKSGIQGVASWLGNFIQVLIRYAFLCWVGVMGLSRLQRFKCQNYDSSLPRGWCSLATHRLAFYASTVVFAGGYVVCGIVKLVNSDFQWVAKVPNLSVQLLKSNWSSYYDTVPQAIIPGHLMPPSSPAWLDQAVQAIVNYPNFARLFFGAGLLIELGAFVILINRRWAFFGGIAIVALHMSISEVMQLHFAYHIAAAIIFLINIPGAILRPKALFGRE
jgi:hypothetical protein